MASPVETSSLSPMARERLARRREAASPNDANVSGARDTGDNGGGASELAPTSFAPLGAPSAATTTPTITPAPMSTSVNATAQPHVQPQPQPVREAMVRNAVAFLQNPKVVASSLSKKRAFLASKGLTSAEIEHAITLVPSAAQQLGSPDVDATPNPAVASPSPYTPYTSTGSPQTPPSSLPPPPVPPRPSPLLTILGTVAATLGATGSAYALYKYFSKPTTAAARRTSTSPARSNESRRTRERSDSGDSVPRDVGPSKSPRRQRSVKNKRISALRSTTDILNQSIDDLQRQLDSVIGTLNSQAAEHKQQISEVRRLVESPNLLKNGDEQPSPDSSSTLSKRSAAAGTSKSSSASFLPEADRMVLSELRTSVSDLKNIILDTMSPAQHLSRSALFSSPSKPIDTSVSPLSASTPNVRTNISQSSEFAWTGTTPSVAQVPSWQLQDTPEDESKKPRNGLPRAANDKRNAASTATASNDDNNNNNDDNDDGDDDGSNNNNNNNTNNTNTTTTTTTSSRSDARSGATFTPSAAPGGDVSWPSVGGGSSRQANVSTTTTTPVSRAPVSAGEGMSSLSSSTPQPPPDTPYSKSFREIMQMVERGETPPDVNTSIDDSPVSTHDQYRRHSKRTSARKPWEQQPPVESRDASNTSSAVSAVSTSDDDPKGKRPIA